MAFWVILRKTLVDLTGLKGNLAITIIGVGISVLLFLGFGFGQGSFGLANSAEIQTIQVVSSFLSMAFMWGAGFFLAIIVSVKGAGLIARESSDGTLTLLVSRPISRRHILAGKFAALVIYGIFLDLIILLLSAVIITLIKPVTDDTLRVLLIAIMHLIPYILLITALFGSISIALSTITAKRIAVTALVCAMVAVIFLFAPMIISIITFNAGDGADKYDYFNLGGHLADIYITLVQTIDGGHLVSGVYSNMSTYIMGTGQMSLELPITDFSDLPVGYTSYPFEFGLRISPVISLAIWLSVIVICLGTAFRTIERKQVT